MALFTIKRAHVIVIAVATNKGGVGKTTLAGCLGAALATLGERTLLCDLDPQCNLSGWMGQGKQNPQHVGELMLAPVEQAATWPTIPVGERLELLPCHRLLNESVDKMRKQKGVPLYYRLRDRLVQLADRFDYVVLDCPPNLQDGMTDNALCAAQVYVVPADPEPFAVEGLADIMQLGQGVQVEQNRQLRFGGFVFPRYNPKVRGALRKSVHDGLGQIYGMKSLLGSIGEDKSVYESQGFKQTLFAYAPGSRAAADYLTLTKKLIGRI